MNGLSPIHAAMNAATPLPSPTPQESGSGEGVFRDAMHHALKPANTPEKHSANRAGQAAGHSHASEQAVAPSGQRAASQGAQKQTAASAPDDPASTATTSATGSASPAVSDPSVTPSNVLANASASASSADGGLAIENVSNPNQDTSGGTTSPSAKVAKDGRVKSDKKVSSPTSSTAALETALTGIGLPAAPPIAAPIHADNLNANSGSGGGKSVARKDTHSAGSNPLQQDAAPANAGFAATLKALPTSHPESQVQEGSQPTTDGSGPASHVADIASPAQVSVPATDDIASVASKNASDTASPPTGTVGTASSTARTTVPGNASPTAATSPATVAPTSASNVSSHAGQNSTALPLPAVSAASRQAASSPVNLFGAPNSPPPGLPAAHAVAQNSSPGITATDTFSAMDGAGASLGGTLLHAAPNRVAVGVSDPGLGWIEVSAQRTGGQISAALTAASTTSHAALTSALPAMTSYLNDHRQPVPNIYVETGQASGQNATGSQQNSHGERQSRNGSASQGVDAIAATGQISKAANQSASRAVQAAPTRSSGEGSQFSVRA